MYARRNKELYTIEQTLTTLFTSVKIDGVIPSVHASDHEFEILSLMLQDGMLLLSMTVKKRIVATVYICVLDKWLRGHRRNSTTNSYCLQTQQLYRRTGHQCPTYRQTSGVNMRAEVWDYVQPDPIINQTMEILGVLSRGFQKVQLAEDMYLQPAADSHPWWLIRWQ